MAGLYYEEFHVGQLFRHDIRRTLTEADNLFFSALPCTWTRSIAARTRSSARGWSTARSPWG